MCTVVCVMKVWVVFRKWSESSLINLLRTGLDLSDIRGFHSGSMMLALADALSLHS